MARKTIDIKMKDRDKELSFTITEMGAIKAERWKFRAIMLLLASDIEMPAGASVEEGVAQFMAGGAEKLFKALSKVDMDRAIALFDELLYGCVELNVGGVKSRLTEDLINANVEDSSTLTKLRFEVLKLHFDFLADAGKLISPEALNTSPQIKVGV